MSFKFKLILIFLSSFLFQNLNIHAQGIEFFKGTWEEALVKAKEEKKLIFVDAYAKWCGPCKVMAKNVFTLEEVGDFFNDNFINMKMDMEESESKTFRGKFAVSAFPTLFFINEKQETVHKSVGGKQANGLIALAKTALSKDDRSGDFAKLYEEGDRSYDLVLEYVKALNAVNKPSLKITNDYLRSKPDISEKQRVLFIFEAITVADTRWYNELVKNKSLLVEELGEDVVDEKIKSICWSTVKKAVEYETYDLVIESKEKIGKIYSGDKKEFGYEADMYYGKEMRQSEMYLESLNNYYKKYAKKDVSKIKTCLSDLVKYFEKDKNAQKKAEELGKSLVKTEKSAEHMFIYATTLYKNDKTDKALKEANKSLELAKEEGIPTREIEKFIRILEQS